MSLACSFEGCSVGETGVCAFENDPATCEHRNAEPGSTSASEVEIEESNDSTDASVVGGAVLQRPKEALAFPSSRTMAPDVLGQMMSTRYTTLVGILGDPESGKTACLASLYLLVANNLLEDWSFRDSKTLMAFEEIVRGARDWNEGRPPEQMTMHTEMADDRRPGFLHLRLERRSDGRRVDFALPDLPGEWTTDLVSTARADRFDFLKSAEAIWVVVDGRTLRDKEKRQGTINRIGQLAGRLTTLFEGTVPRFILVITHRDQGDLPDTVKSRIEAELSKRHVDALVVHVAPFSENGQVKPGHGIREMIDATVMRRHQPEFWPHREVQNYGRFYLAYRRVR